MGGPPSSAGNPAQQQSPHPSAPPSVAGGPAASSSGRPPSGGFDGPGEPRKTNPFGQGVGFDPARDPKKEEPRKFNTRVELPCYRDNVSNTFCLLMCDVMFGHGVFAIRGSVVAASRKCAKLHGIAVLVISGDVTDYYCLLVWFLQPHRHY
ncbi:hypothetical protein NHQ30_008356 [Ciborinia camelliae]|nr:hypothetical protein NHQ30_008356 [Ciborinia camelliae]